MIKNVKWDDESTMIIVYFNSVLVSAEWPKYGWPSRGKDLSESEMQTISNTFNFQIWAATVSVKEYRQAIKREIYYKILKISRSNSMFLEYRSKQ